MYFFRQSQWQVKYDLTGTAVSAPGKDPAADQGVYVKLGNKIAKSPAGEWPQFDSLAESSICIVRFAGSDRAIFGFSRSFNDAAFDGLRVEGLFNADTV